MGTLLLILIIVIFCWPWISRWLRKFLAHRTEDYLRKATGMPPRPGSREERKQQRASQQAYSSNSRSSEAYSRRTRSQRRPRHGGKEPIIPPEYAEDVEFVEIKSFSETTIGVHDGKVKEYHEKQVTDAEWVEIKGKR